MGRRLTELVALILLMDFGQSTRRTGRLKKHLARLATMTLVMAWVPVLANSASAASAQTTRVSVGSSGVEANRGSSEPSLSGDGRYAVFHSGASNLVADDTNGATDIFLHDRDSGTTARLPIGVQGDGDSYSPVISRDGRYVAFYSGASNLVTGDTNNKYDVFLYDRTAGTTTLVSTSSSGEQGNGHSWTPSISADGRYVAFASDATNLVVGDTNFTRDIFVKDLATGLTSRVSVSSTGDQANSDAFLYPSVSGDGRYITFATAATNLVSGDMNVASDVFVRDTNGGSTLLVSKGVTGESANGASQYPSISRDGTSVVFESSATDLVPGDTNAQSDVFLSNLGTSQITLISLGSFGDQGNGASQARFGAISDDDKFIVFQSSASNLVSGDTNGVVDIFLRDRDLGETTRVSMDSNGNQANDSSQLPTLSGGGLSVAFESSASNLVSGDTNSVDDIFVHRASGPQIPRYLVLGDSVSYGHGLANPRTTSRRCNDPGTPVCSLPPNQGPSPLAFPSLLAARLGLVLSLRPSGCALSGDQLAVSGATSTFGNDYGLNSDGSVNYSQIIWHDKDCDKTKAHKSIQPDELLIDQLTFDPPELVTLLAGANDIFFLDCFFGELKQFGFGPTAFGAQVEEIHAKDCLVGQNLRDLRVRLAILETGLQQILDHVHQDVPRARLLLLNYYQPIPPPAATLTTNNALCNALAYTGKTKGGMASQTRKRTDFWVHGVAINQMLNQAIANVAARNSWVVTVDLSSAFLGHELCTQDPYVFSLTDAGFPLCCGEEWWRVIHPTEHGQRVLADRICATIVCPN